MNSLKAFECYDHLLLKPFHRKGWKAETVSWRNKAIRWDTFDAVIIRSCWDYQQEPGHFLKILEEIDQSSTLLANSLDLVKWNINKIYLRELSEQGIATVPSRWFDKFVLENISACFSYFDTNEVIIKPSVGANADDTFRLKKAELKNDRLQLKNAFSDTFFLVQPFMQKIVEEGEYSLFYFNGRFSHAILKTPKPGDFRAQEEHGGRLRLIEATPQLLEAADKTMKKLPGQPLYARVDFVKNNANFALMEVELIEPSLYFNMDLDSPQRFAEAFERWWKGFR